MSRGGAVREREGERIPSRLRAASMEPDAGLDPVISRGPEIMTWAETRRLIHNINYFLFAQLRDVCRGPGWARHYINC